MKTLLLLRHAKSSWDDDSLPDHRRPLAPRGRRAAPAVAEHLRRLDVLPDLVLSSTSQRTRQTIELALEELDEPMVEFDEALYLAGPSQMLRSIRATDDHVDTLMMVGHNPGMHEIAIALTDRDPSTAAARLDAKFPTAAVAVVEFDVDRWEDVGPGLGRLAHFVRPKDLPNAERDRL
jgi:phosphohistidine phosphatase